MATLMLLFSRSVDAIKRVFAKPQSRRDALFILEDADRYWNLHASVAIVSFFVSAGLGVLAFFLINDLVLLVGVSKQVASALIAISWVLIFPVWALVFLLIMSGLYALGIKDIRSIVRSRLSNLTLSRGQLRDLGNALASRTWRHGRIFKSVVADLTEEQLQH